jgi:hypothetical protein
MNIIRVLVWALLPFMLAAYANAEPITLESLLSEMTDRSAVARFPSPAYTTRQTSSSDRASTSKDNPETWFANNDFNHFLRKERRQGRDEWVLLDAKGPGAVVRLWSPNPKGTLRIYLDGSESPTFESPMADLLAGKATLAGVPITEPLAATRSQGWNLYLPIPYAGSCVITSDQDGFYYHVNFRTYAEGTPVSSLNPAMLAAARPAIAAASAALRTPQRTQLLPGMPTTLDPGQTQSLELGSPGGPSQAISTLAVLFDAKDLEEALRSTILEITFDGTPTVWCPLGDFFGSGVGLNPFADHYRQVTPEGILRSYFIMPFRSTATVTLRNLGSSPVSASLAATADPHRWTSRSMYFHSGWTARYPIRTNAGKGTIDFNYATITGKGVYLGDTLAVMNPVPQWWGEGDEKISVDREEFPSHFGTGTEDYYGYGWCNPNTFNMPFISQPRCDGRGRDNFGHTTVTRVRALDAIPFTSHLNVDMEVWHWAQADVAYAATTYWYALPGATSNRGPAPELAAAPLPRPPERPRPFAIPNAIELESATIVEKSAGMAAEFQAMEGFARNTWSNDAHLWCKGSAVGDFVELAIPASKRSRVTLYATRSWDYAAVTFSAWGRDLGKPIDLASGAQGKVIASGPIDLGTISPIDGVIRLRATITGKGPASLPPGTYFGLDAVVLSEP